MTVYGLTPTGFVPRVTTDIVASFQAAFQAQFGISIDLTPSGPFGQLIGLMSAPLGELWSVAQAVNAGSDPDEAEGASLVSVCAITGTLPRAATSSTVNAFCVGTNGTVLLAGRTASVLVTKARFDTLADGTITTATSWATSQTHVADDITTNGGNLYVCTVGGAGAVAGGGPTGTGTSITDGGGSPVLWNYIAVGTAFASIPAACETAGPVLAPAGQLATIETPVSGWTSVTNLVAAVAGSTAETDTGLRVRRQAELLGSTEGTVEGVRTHVAEDVTGVTVCTLFNNPSDITDGNGLPPHSFETLVVGGLDQDIGNMIYLTAPIGVTTYGSTSVNVTDAANGNQTYVIKFSRPTTQNIYIIANITVDASLYPADGDAQVAAALLTFGNAFLPGQDVVASRLEAKTFTIPGLLDASCLIGTAPTPTLRTTIPSTLRQLALFDPTRIIVNSTPGTP